MKYVKEIRSRSIFLWRALFDGREPVQTAASVYIEPEAETKAASASGEEYVPAINENGGSTEERLTQKTAALETAEYVLRGIGAAESAVGSGMTGGSEEDSAVGAVKKRKTAGGAALLLEQVQAAERSADFLQRSVPAQAVPETPAVGRDIALPQSVDWSACFERDARRYDGVHELL